MPNMNYFQWLGLSLDANTQQIQQALANKLQILQQAQANQQQTQLQYQENQQQMQIYQMANQTLTDEAKRLHHRQEIEALMAQTNQQALTVTAPGPNNTASNYTCSMILPSTLPTPKPGQFFSSWDPKNWNIVDSNNNPVASNLKTSIVERLYKIEHTLYSKIANELKNDKDFPGGLTLTKSATNSSGVSSFTFTTTDSNGNTVPLTPAQQAKVQSSYVSKFDDVAKSLAQTGDPFKIQLGPAPSPALQQQQQARQTQTTPLDSSTPSPSTTPTLRPPGSK